jgi:hypothetical protein
LRCILLPQVCKKAVLPILTKRIFQLYNPQKPVIKYMTKGETNEKVYFSIGLVAVCFCRLPKPHGGGLCAAAPIV